MGVVGKSYLVLYNVAQFLGWSYMLYLLSPHLRRSLEGGDRGQLYVSIGNTLKLFQTLAVLEILHAAVGLVKSNPLLTGFQVFSRVFITWAIVHTFSEAQTARGFPLLLLAWIITEIIRYSYYAFNLIGLDVYLVTWLRYTLFIFLYPLGVTGELWVSIASLDHIKRESTYSLAMPNTWNFAFNFHVVLIMIMLSYIPIFPQLYFHMFAQRRKIIGGEKKKAA